MLVGKTGLIARTPSPRMGTFQVTSIHPGFCSIILSSAGRISWACNAVIGVRQTSSRITAVSHNRMISFIFILAFESLNKLNIEPGRDERSTSNAQRPTSNKIKKLKTKTIKQKINVDLFFLFRPSTPLRAVSLSNGCFNTCYKNLDEFLSFL